MPLARVVRLALLNPPDSGGNAVIMLQPIDGMIALPIELDEPITITLAPGEKISAFLDTLSPGIQDFWGWVSIDVSGPSVWGVALEQRGNGVLTTRELTPLE